MSRFVLRHCALLAERNLLARVRDLRASSTDYLKDQTIGILGASGPACSIVGSLQAGSSAAPRLRQLSTSASQIGAGSAQVGVFMTEIPVLLTSRSLKSIL